MSYNEFYSKCDSSHVKACLVGTIIEPQEGKTLHINRYAGNTNPNTSGVGDKSLKVYLSYLIEHFDMRIPGCGIIIFVPDNNTEK